MNDFRSSLPRPSKEQKVRAPRKPAPRADRVRELILAIALESFSAQGFSGTSTRSIAKLAGVRHSLVNYHFDSKERLWIAAVNDVLEKHIREWNEAVSAPDIVSAGQKLRLYIKIYCGAAATAPEIFQIIRQQSTQTSERLDWLIDNHLKGNYDNMIGIIEEAQTEGAIIMARPEHIFYLIVSSVEIFYAVPNEYRKLTGKSPIAISERHQITKFLTGLIFKEC